MYLTSNTGTFSAPWNLLGVAIRIAYQIGAHRALVYKPERNLVDELWRRAFWCVPFIYQRNIWLRLPRILVVFDRHLCVAFGHGSALREESCALYDTPAPYLRANHMLADSTSSYLLRSMTDTGTSPSRSSHIRYGRTHRLTSRVI